MLSTSNQAYVFLSTVYAGFIIGFFYDCCRIVRKMIKAGVIVTGILDLVFWSMMGMLSFLVIFYVNDGDVRLYNIAGFAIGWILYILALSPFVMKALNWIYKTLARAFNWLMKILLWPFHMLLRGMAFLFRRLKAILSPFLVRLKSKIKSIFKKSAKNPEQ